MARVRAAGKGKRASASAGAGRPLGHREAGARARGEQRHSAPAGTVFLLRGWEVEGNAVYIALFCLLQLPSSQPERGPRSALAPHSGHSANCLCQEWQRRHRNPEHMSPAWLLSSAPHILSHCFCSLLPARKGRPFLPPSRTAAKAGRVRQEQEPGAVWAPGLESEGSPSQLTRSCEAVGTLHNPPREPWFPFCKMVFARSLTLAVWQNSGTNEMQPLPS